MVIFRNLLNFLHSFYLAVLISLFFLFCLSGIVVSTPFPVESILDYQVSVFPSGIALFQSSDSHHFYSFSPLNDYTVNSKNIKSPLLSFEEFNSDEFKKNLEKPFWEKIALSFQSYINYPGHAQLTYDGTKSIPVKYLAKINKNSMNVSAVFNNVDQVKKIGLTLKFNADDHIYIDGQKITDKNSFNQLSALTDKLGNKKELSQPQQNIVQTGKVIIQNDSLPGSIVVNAGKAQKMLLDLENNLVVVEQEFPEAKTNATSSIEVEIYNSLDSALKSNL